VNGEGSAASPARLPTTTAGFSRGGLRRKTPEPLTLLRRVAVLRQVPAFSELPEAVLRHLAAGLSESRHAAGQVVVREGERGDRAFVIVEGRAEVTAAASPGAGAITLATLFTGELFGELALLQAEGRRQATVTALTSLTLLVISETRFTALLSEFPEAKTRFQNAAARMEQVRFLKRASPFAALAPAALLKLLDRLTTLAVEGGELLLRQGETGQACYLVQRGEMEVFREEGGAERHLATLGPGSLFGEGALLTDTPRNASVRALRAGKLLVLQRDDLLAASRAAAAVGWQMLELLRLRDRPVRVDGVLVSKRVADDGEVLTILKNPYSGTYFSLSRAGWFVWQHLDGRHTLKDLTLAWFDESRTFAPEAIAQVLSALGQAGFLQDASRSMVLQETMRPTGPPSWLQRLGAAARGLLQWQVNFRRVDAWLERLYWGGVRFLYHPVAQLVFAVLAGMGLGAGLLLHSRLHAVLHTHFHATDWWLFLLPAYAVALLLHEAGHAFTAKAFGRHIPRIGIGWYWFGPIAFVDTSDMWLAGKWPRIAVSLAGPYVNLVMAGVATAIALSTTRLRLIALLCQFILICYVLIVANLNPLMEYDGYFILMDLLERPNLRSRCLRWLGEEMPRAWRRRGELRRHWLEITYGFAALVYLASATVLTVVSARNLLPRVFGTLLPAPAIGVLIWLVALVVLGVSGAGIMQELRPRKNAGVRG